MRHFDGLRPSLIMEGTMAKGKMILAKEIKTVGMLASKLALDEGLKHKISIGDAREVVSILSDIIYNRGGDIELLGMLYKNGKRRLKKVSK